MGEKSYFSGRQLGKKEQRSLYATTSASNVVDVAKDAMQRKATAIILKTNNKNTNNYRQISPNLAGLAANKKLHKGKN